MTHLLATFDPSTTEVLGSFVVMLGGFFGVAKLMLNQASKDREADRTERVGQNTAFVAALGEVAESNRAIAKATEKGNREAEKRNGHLAELTIQSKEDTLKAIGHLKVQHVDKQTVTHEHVENKD